MPETSIPDTLLTQLADLERRVRDMEQSAQTQYSSVKEGTLSILDAAGNAVILIGKTGANKYGIVIFSPDGRSLFAAGREISAAPPLQVGMVVGTSAIISGTSFRPGTTATSLTEIWRGEVFAVGPDIFWSVTVFPNLGNMDFQVTIQDETAGGTEQSVYSESGITVNGSRNGTFTIPTSCLAPGTGTDVLGRFYFLRMKAQRNSGAASVDIALGRFPLNANFV